jgi:hypothetical protein
MNGVYTQLFNRSHGRNGHLFQGRIYSDQKQGVSRRAAKLAENNKKNRLRIHLFLGVSAPQRENAF